MTKYKSILRWVITQLLLFIGVCPVAGAQQAAGWETPFEASGGTATATYAEGIAYYERLAAAYAEIDIRTFGSTDAGYPLHLVTLSASGDFDPSTLHADGKAILLVINAIHAGETDGVDASMMWIRDLVQNLDEYADQLDGVAIAVVPFFNIGGVLNRSPWNRVNQNGPAEMGFRGNARNYNLNRDLTKADTRNVRTFWEIFHYLDPDMFVDNHVSNGADFQHVVTQVYSQKDKLGGSLAGYFEEELWPRLSRRMEAEGLPMVPYVNAGGGRLEEGWVQYHDTPRYTTGYTALFQAIGFMPELHMLKPYDMRVRAAYTFMDELLRTLADDRARIIEFRARDREAVRTQETFPIYWEVDRSVADSAYFLGYQATSTPSEVTGEPRLLYDRDQPWAAWVPFYDTYRPTVEVRRPAAYIIPAGWHDVIDRLAENRVRMEPLAADTTLAVDVYRIEDYSSRSTPYEGHYFHDDVSLRTERREVRFRAGDLVIPVDQIANRFIVETLEPEAHDSFFRWNFFDTVLQRHEGYSGYVFEETAAAMLRDSAEFRERFEDRKGRDADFAADPDAQLDWIFENSPYYEAEYMTYPVYRLPR